MAALYQALSQLVRDPRPRKAYVGCTRLEKRFFKRAVANVALRILPARPDFPDMHGSPVRCLNIPVKFHNPYAP